MLHRVRMLGYFCLYLFRRFGEDSCAKNAAALTYTTLFAVVPVMTVAYAMLAAIPAFNQVGGQIEGFIFENFVPSTGAALREYLTRFSNQARQLTGIGVIFLIITALMMMLTIEKAFNAIWRIRQPRRGVTSFLLYWAVLSLGPLLLGAAFLISTYLASLSFFSPDSILAMAANSVPGWLPLVLTVAAFTLIYIAVPNTRVRLKHALAGGVLVAVLFEAAKACFGLYVAWFPSYQLIYGAFAAFPLFLLWIYVSWAIILFGAELVCNLGNSTAWRRSTYPWLVSLMGVLKVFLQAQRRGEVVDLEVVNNAGWTLPEDRWIEMTEWLGERRIITRAQEGGYVLSWDLAQLELVDLLEDLPDPLPSVASLPLLLNQDDQWYVRLREALVELEDSRRHIMSGSVQCWLDGESKTNADTGET